ncbi:alpha/beta hydrolase [Salinisphaera sp. P385]|uniref:Alpha/beta hydrolase n=1 Tax=Spectribacter acetivorans TaxID=3075603 RepID=A0ABU3B978_9GAMM|nr:alpha/beta hydrolase [Salinisphaera sp. P385]MDT0619028.1 alpha/beta hydrolase [Salinisphaera sp. P385]
MRQDIEFNTEDGVTLRGWWYPGNGDGATVVMAHGFSATKEMYLDGFAEVFAEAGLNVLVYDNRCLGESGGEPRGEIDPWMQVRDYRDAITWVSQRDDVNAERIGIWGSSYSGGHVLMVAAMDRRVKCVVSQVPLVHGGINASRLVRADLLRELRRNCDADRVARYNGEAPAMVPVVAEKEGDPCVLPTADSTEFFLQIPPERTKHWRNECTMRSVDLFASYEPGFYAPLISPTPVMVAAAVGDVLTPFDVTASVFEKMLQPKKFVTLPGGHFDAYVDEAFAISAPQQRDWFRAHLAA